MPSERDRSAATIIRQNKRVALLVHAQGVYAEDGWLAVALPYPVRGLGFD